MNSTLTLTINDVTEAYRLSDEQLAHEAVISFLTDGEYSSMPANVKRFRASATRGQRLAAKIPFVRTGLLPLNTLTAGAQHYIASAGKDIAAAAANGNPRATSALAAFHAMQPGIDELFLELDADLEAVLPTETLLDVVAELRAVAALLLAQETRSINIPTAPAVSTSLSEARLTLIRSVAG